MKRWLAMTFLGAAIFAGCGDVNKVQVGLAFPDDTTEKATHQLLFIVREAPKNGNGCSALWSGEASSLPQNMSTIIYPYKNDVVAAPIDLNEYTALSLFVYAFPTADTSQASARALAGGCEQIITTDRSDIVITLQKRPGAGS